MQTFGKELCAGYNFIMRIVIRLVLVYTLPERVMCNLNYK